MEEIEEPEDLSPIIQIFERLVFQRNQELHDQVSSMIDLFSLSEVSRILSRSIVFTSVFALGYLRHVRYIN